VRIATIYKPSKINAIHDPPQVESRKEKWDRYLGGLPGPLRVGEKGEKSADRRRKGKMMEGVRGVRSST
jgi:hypothetical protein